MITLTEVLNAQTELQRTCDRFKELVAQYQAPQAEPKIVKYILPPTVSNGVYLYEGERYAGAIIRPDLSGYHLIRMPLEVASKLKWQAAMDHAASKGGELPDRPEGALLFATREPSEFAEKGYWLREQADGDDAYAWCQHFGNGYQFNAHKDSQYRVVLVRRVPL